MHTATPNPQHVKVSLFVDERRQVYSGEEGTWQTIRIELAEEEATYKKYHPATAYADVSLVHKTKKNKGDTLARLAAKDLKIREFQHP